MAMPTPEEVYAIASHLTGTDLTIFIQDAYDEVIEAGVPDAKAARPARWLTAHLATLDVRRTVEQSVSDMRLKYANDSSAGVGLESTPYGQEYMRLMGLLLGGKKGLNLVVI